MTVKEVRNPEGYYKYSAKFYLQFDPLLLNSLESITIQSTIEPGGREVVNEKIQPKKLVNGVHMCVYILYACLCVCCFCTAAKGFAML